MRILQVHTRYRQRGGEDVVVEAERLLLQRARHEVFQHFEENPASLRASATAMAGSIWNPAAARRVEAMVEAVRPDVAHVHNTWVASSPSVVSTLHRKGVPVVMTVHNYRLACANALFLRDGAPCEKCLGRGPWPAVRHGCYRNSRTASAVAAVGMATHSRMETWSRSVDRFIVLSKFAGERLIRADLPPGKIKSGSNFVPDPGPRPAAPSLSSYVTFVGRLMPEKGVSVLLDAWRIARPPGLRLLVIGDGPERARLEAVASPGVQFRGHCTKEEVTAAVLGARALVIPSVWYEMQPLTALEGLAAGSPLVLSDIGGLPELIGGRQAGWLSPPDDATGLARILERLADGRAVDERGAQARHRYLEAYTASDALGRLEDAYREAMDTK